MRTALLVIDMINPYRHEDAARLTDSVEDMVEPLSKLLEQARQRDDIEPIYVNDNYGDFSATRDDLVALARAGNRPDLIDPIAPSPDCAFLTKVRHSAFYSTSLEYLLRQHGIKRLILTGQVTEQCVLYTALDAYVRHFTVSVPTDGVAHIDRELGEAALRMMERNMHAELTITARCLD